ncbi:MAG: hypothetical protein V4480_00530 [Patescibacteria group bacterium]
MTGEWVSTLQLATGAVACILTFLYALFSGKSAWPKPCERVVFGLVLLPRSYDDGTFRKGQTT